VVIALRGRANRLHILGQVCLTTGFPIEGNDGEEVARYVLEYANGRTREVPLRNGYEVARSNLIYDATRIDPEPSETQRALVFVKDTAREHYQLLLYSLSLEGTPLARLRCRLNQEQPPFALFAITSETFSQPGL
jgi:hypothetical protein